jgi:hypothetical protein
MWNSHIVLLDDVMSDLEGKKTSHDNILKCRMSCKTKNEWIGKNKHVECNKAWLDVLTNLILERNEISRETTGSYCYIEQLGIST